MSGLLLLDEMFSDAIAVALTAKGHDVVSVVAQPGLVSLPDEQILAEAVRQGRGLVTMNIRDFMALDAQYRATGRSHAGLVLVSARTFPQDRGFTGAVVGAVDALLRQPKTLECDRVVFLRR
ncbi:MAG TPA: DUF5615 family PIN-like protein [Frankiaceae bacterium]|nr:DUF5615 family PIN-like protein [Frankiaceae bacterium]